MKVFLWGTGNVAETFLRQCQTLSQYEVLGFIDNNPEKQGSVFWEVPVYAPEILKETEPDRIVILSDSYEEIYQQIMGISPFLEPKIENKNFFYKESILKRYEMTEDREILQVLKYIKKNGLDIFNYEFAEKYKNIPVEVFWDSDRGMFYVIHKRKRLYFSRDLDNNQKVTKYYRFLLMEQDSQSPHKYLSQYEEIEAGSVVADVGAAEGLFSIEIIDRVSKLYILEADPGWVEALKATFKDYSDKAVIIEKFISSYDDGNMAALDSLINGPVNFIKMDIEGNEWDALQGAKRIIQESINLKCAICCYHGDFDQVLIEDFMDKNNLQYHTTSGFIWFPWTIRQNYVSTRLNRAVVRGYR